MSVLHGLNHNEAWTGTVRPAFCLAVEPFVANIVGVCALEMKPETAFTRWIGSIALIMQDQQVPFSG